MTLKMARALTEPAKPGPRMSPATFPMSATGALKNLERTIWGHAAVEGRINPGSLPQFVTSTVFGGMKALAGGGPGALLEMLATSVSRTLIAEFERHLKQATIAAYEEGYRAGMAEGIARERAARRAVEGAKTIFPAAERALAKRDYAEGMRLAQELQAEHGTKAANVEPEEDTEDIPMSPVTSISGWVQGAGLVKGKLAIQFRGGKSGPVVCVYSNAGRAALADLLAAPSAGKWVHRHVYREDYALA